VVAHQVDHRRAGAAGIVQVGHGIGQAGSQVQQSDRRPAGHARKTVSGSGTHPFEKAQHRLDPRLFFHGRHQMDFSGARIGQAKGHAGIGKGSHQAFGCEHRVLS
jgi:hypothetical protein